VLLKMRKSKRKDHISTNPANMRLPAILARGASSTILGLNSRLCAANKKGILQVLKGEDEVMAGKGEKGNKLTGSFAFTCLF